MNWPPTRTDKINAVEATYVAGYGDAEDVPQSLKSAMLLVLAHIYENREAITALDLKTVPMAADSLLGQFDWGGYQ